MFWHLPGNAEATNRLLYLEHMRGAMFYRAEMWKIRQRVWSRVPLVSPEGKLPDYNDHEAMWGDDIYFKGAWVMHTLRYLVGDDVLFPAIRRLIYGSDAPQPGAIRPVSRTTQDFRAILEDMGGGDLSWFFDANFYQAELPELVAARDGHALVLAWETPSDLAFEMSVEVRVGEELRRVAMPGGQGRVELGSSETHYLLDPANRILRHDAAVEAWQNRESEDLRGRKLARRNFPEAMSAPFSLIRPEPHGFISRPPMCGSIACGLLSASRICSASKTLATFSSIERLNSVCPEEISL